VKRGKYEIKKDIKERDWKIKCKVNGQNIRIRGKNGSGPTQPSNC
jgi:hypothetical protein